MEFRVELSPKAYNDIDCAKCWIAEHISSAAAEKWEADIFDALESLSEYPARCPIAPEDKAVDFEVRHLLCGGKQGGYRIVFTIELNEKVPLVWVYAVRHSSRQPMIPDDLEN